MKRFFFIIMSVCLVYASMAQDRHDAEKKEKLIQFSGVILEADSLFPIAFASVYDISAKNATHADVTGFFSFVARCGDTILFAAVGYKRAMYVLPDTLSLSRYSMVQLLKSDTVVLPGVTVYPWPSREEFAEVFLNLELPASDIENMNRNMTLAELKHDNFDFGTDAIGSYKNSMAIQYTRLYQTGQIPTLNLLSPTAWAKFVQAWKRGDFKKKE